MRYQIRGGKTNLLQPWITHWSGATAPLHHVHGLESVNQLFCTPERLDAQHRVGDAHHCRIVVHYDVVEIFGLAQFNTNTGDCIEAANGCRLSQMSSSE